MKPSPFVVVTGGLLMLLTFMPAKNASALDKIHDVYVMGNSLPGPVTAPPPPAPNCVNLAIGSTGGGSNYGVLILQSTDQTNAAQLLAIENNQNCFNQPSNATRDQLFLSNTNVIPTATGVNTNLTIEYRADFDSGPDGSVIFGGYMKGTFMKKDSTGTYSPVTCNGSVPPNGPCTISYSSWVYSQYTGQEYPLAPVTSTNPFLGKFNISVPAGSGIPMGNGLGRTFHGRITIVLPSTDHMVQLSGGAIVEKIGAEGPP